MSMNAVPKTAVARAVLFAVVAAHFVPRALSKRGRQTSRSSLVAVAYALRAALGSSSLWGTLATATVVSWAARRFARVSPNLSFPAFAATMWALLYTQRVIEEPVVSYRRSFWNNSLVERAKLAESTYRPVVWGYNSHLQTVTCYALGALEWLFWADPIVYARETIPAHDPPNELFLDWASTGDTPKHDMGADHHLDVPIVLCIHGLGDDRNIPYLKAIRQTVPPARHARRHVVLLEI